MNSMFEGNLQKGKGDSEETNVHFTNAEIDRLIDRTQTGSNFDTFGREEDVDEDEENQDSKKNQNNIILSNLKQFNEHQDLGSLTEFEGQEYRKKATKKKQTFG